jgi:hypothetical protein
MTFVIALLREQGSGTSAITVYFTLLGLAVMASSRIWAGLLDRHKSGRVLALLNALLGVATLLPAVTMASPLVIASGLLFGGVFLSVVASTAALVRHNPAAQPVGRRHRRFHRSLRSRSDRWSHRGGLHCRWSRRFGAGAGLFCGGAVGGCGFRLATAGALKPKSALPQTS